jgi:hypothetical protein
MTASMTGYVCSKWHDEPTGFGVDCKNGQHPHFLDINQTRLIGGSAQLACQHLLVVKDKMEYYDLLLAFEDNMLVSNTYIKQHLKWSRNVQQLVVLMQEEESKTTSTKGKINNNWRSPTLSCNQLQPLRPGFIRVKVLAKGAKTQPFMDIPVVVDDNNNTTTTTPSLSFDPTICCRAPHFKPQRTVLCMEDIMIWEMAISALEIR